MQVVTRSEIKLLLRCRDIDGGVLWTVLLVSKDCKGKRAIAAGTAVVFPSWVKKNVEKANPNTWSINYILLWRNKNGESPREMVNNNCVHQVKYHHGTFKL